MTNEQSPELEEETVSNTPILEKEHSFDHERALSIAGNGDYLKIQRELENEGLLAEETARVREKFDYIFSTMLEVRERDLEMLTILELYDEGTAKHCAETFRIAREKVEKHLASGVVLESLFAQELVSPDEFFRACLLHDIGKVDIPRFVIQHPMNDHQMDMYLRDLVVDEHDTEILTRLEEEGGILPHVATVKELEAYLQEHHLRSVHFVPARLVLSKGELAELESRGFDGNMSLMDIIKKHELFSRNILRDEGLLVESDIAGAHHNYEGQGSRYPIASSALHMSVDVAELLHIADVQQALSATRSYKKGFSKPRVLRIIMEEVARGRISEEAAYLWIDDDMHEMTTHTDTVVSLDDARDMKLVREQLAHIRSRIDEDPVCEERWRRAS